MSDTTEPLLVSAMRRHASNPRVHVRVGVPGASSSTSTTAAGFLAELDAYVEAVRAEARTVAAEQVEAAARALYESASGMTPWPSVSPSTQEAWLHKARRALSAAGFTVPEETQP